MIPLEVDTIAIPKPFKTRGKSPELLYFLSPGVLTLLIFLIAGILVIELYFKAKPSACEDVSTSPKSAKSPAPPPPSDCRCKVVIC